MTLHQVAMTPSTADTVHESYPFHLTSTLSLYFGPLAMSTMADQVLIMSLTSLAYVEVLL